MFNTEEKFSVWNLSEYYPIFFYLATDKIIFEWSKVKARHCYSSIDHAYFISIGLSFQLQELTLNAKNCPIFFQ